MCSFFSSIIDPDMPDAILPDVPVTYTVVEIGSQHGQVKLVSSDGYTCQEGIFKKLLKLK
jgi:hypothetical protein